MEDEVAHLRRRLREDPRSLAFVPLAEALRRAGRPADAMSALRAGFRHHPDHSAARVVLARLHLEAGARHLAEGVLEEVVKSDPDNLSAASLLAGLYVEAGRLREARALAERAGVTQDPVLQALAVQIRPEVELVGNPADPFDRERHARQLASRGHPTLALSAWRRLADANPQSLHAAGSVVELEREVAARSQSDTGARLVRRLEAQDGPPPSGEGPLADWARNFWER